IETKLARITGETIRVAAAGRTDAGVHATGQVISFTTGARVPTEKFAIAVNSLAPYSVVMRRVEEAPAGVQARFSATSRSYQYAILRGDPSPLMRRYTAWVPEVRRLERMEAALRQVIGQHDFTSFCAAGAEVRDKTRTVSSARMVERGRLLLIRITADGFL